MQSLIQHIRTQLSDVYSPEELREIAFLVLEKITGCNRAEILTKKVTELSVKQQIKLETILSRLKNSEPIQYIFGETEFYGLPFFVTPDVLIPRPETEELVNWIVSKFKVQSSKFKVLDIGTGSGCIAVALAKHLPRASVTAMDISSAALAVAQKNADRNNVLVKFLEKDILSLHDISEKYDVIVSNPPYVSETEKNEIAENVLNFEPHLALFVANRNPLIFYEAIAYFAKKQLNDGGFLYFEINRMFGSTIIELLQKKGFSNVELRKDMFGNDRMVRAMVDI